MLITPHFSLDEFAQPARYGFISSIPYPPEWISDRLTLLCEQLEKIRHGCGDKPMRIVSGYRSPTYNAAVYKAAGQPPTSSQHSLGKAADIVVMGLDAKDVHAVAFRLWRSKMIQIGGLAEYSDFVHVDIRDSLAGHLAQWTGSRNSSI